MFLVGGAAMVLAYNRNRSTRDLDAVFEPKTAVHGWFSHKSGTIRSLSSAVRAGPGPVGGSGGSGRRRG